MREEKLCIKEHRIMFIIQKDLKELLMINIKTLIIPK